MTSAQYSVDCTSWSSYRTIRYQKIQDSSEKSYRGDFRILRVDWWRSKCLLLKPIVDMWQSQHLNISEVCVYSSWKISSYPACNWKYLRLENRITNCQIHPLPCCTMTKTIQKVTFRNVKICYLYMKTMMWGKPSSEKMATLWKMGDADP